MSDAWVIRMKHDFGNSNNIEDACNVVMYTCDIQNIKLTGII